MRKAITTKYFGPGNVRGSKIRASANGVRSLFYDFSHANSIDERHALAAKALAEKFDWSGLYVAGGIPDESGNVYVCMCGHYEGNQREGFGREGEDWFYVEPRENVK